MSSAQVNDSRRQQSIIITIIKYKMSKQAEERLLNERPSAGATGTFPVNKKRASAVFEIASYYGFTPIHPPAITKSDLAKAKLLVGSEHGSYRQADNENCSLGICAEEKVAILRTYSEMFPSLPQPLFIFFEGGFADPPSRLPARRQARGRVATTQERRANLEIIGNGKSVAEAILIQTSIAILAEEGFENLYVEINSVGDRDSNTRFARELTGFYRKRLSELPAHCRQTFKRDVLELFACREKKCRDLMDEAPESLNFLNEQSKTHFKEVLEYLETLNIPYRINHRLAGNCHFVNHTVFEIKSIDDETAADGAPPLAAGFRYSGIAKKIGLKQELASAGAALAYRKKSSRPSSRSVKIKKPLIYFIQLGFEAKLKSLLVLEMLRREKIPVHQSLPKDKLTAQLSAAENLRIPYAVIMGQKEAMENSVIVRNMGNRSQETIPLAELPGYLKHIKRNLS